MARDDLYQQPAQPRLKAVDPKVPAQYLSMDAIPPAERARHERQVNHAASIRAQHAARNSDKSR